MSLRIVRSIAVAAAVAVGPGAAGAGPEWTLLWHHDLGG